MSNGNLKKLFADRIVQQMIERVAGELSPTVINNMVIRSSDEYDAYSKRIGFIQSRAALNLLIVLKTLDVELHL